MIRLTHRRACVSLHLSHAVTTTHIKIEKAGAATKPNTIIIYYLRGLCPVPALPCVSGCHTVTVDLVQISHSFIYYTNNYIYIYTKISYLLAYNSLVTGVKMFRDKIVFGKII